MQPSRTLSKIQEYILIVDVLRNTVLHKKLMLLEDEESKLALRAYEVKEPFSPFITKIHESKSK